MNNKKLYIRAIISGTLLLIGCFCFMLWMNKLNALSDKQVIITSCQRDEDIDVYTYLAKSGKYERI